MKRILMFFALACFVLPVYAQTLQCTFTQSRTIHASGKVINSEGAISFEAPDHLNMVYSVPEGDYLIISGIVLSSCTNGQKMVVDTSKNPRFRSLRNTLLNCIMGEYETAAADNDAELEVSEKNGTKTVKMTARKPQPRGYSQIVVDYNKKGHPVRMALEEFNGITTEYQFKY
ncbi:MAG: outer membrane lipoprotein carrier protein LolA [Bacteroidales bacterium]|nr:outer membrane lipoprotein carrier protein LolA [Bacteroidales bacterium]